MNTICKDCALRLYNTKSYNLQGVGNPFYGNCIVVPNVDYKAYKGKSMSFSSQVEVIKEVLIPLTGVEESNFYVVPLIRCNEQISREIDKRTFDNCLYWFAECQLVALSLLRHLLTSASRSSGRGEVKSICSPVEGCLNPSVCACSACRGQILRQFWM